VPGTTDIFENQVDAEALLSRCGALVFVIDSQDDYLEALQKLFVTIIRAQKINPAMYFEVLIHKVTLFMTYTE
jgi:Ras-related GTP-binding protein C/D